MTRSSTWREKKGDWSNLAMSELQCSTISKVRVLLLNQELIYIVMKMYSRATTGTNGEIN